MSLPDLLDGLSSDERVAIEHHLEAVRYAAGARIFEEGAEGDGCYLIDSGAVRLEVARPELDTDSVLGFVEAGGVLGELSLLDQEPRSASAWCETDVTARRLSAGGIETLLAERPVLGARIYGALGRDAARKLRSATDRLVELDTSGRDAEVDDLVARAGAALEEFSSWDDERIDDLLGRIAHTIAEHAAELAEATVRDTHIGNAADKTVKNRMASLGIYASLVGRPGRGVLHVDDERGVTELASPAGVVFALIPMTNPVATAVFKTLIALKGGNALILSFHRAALGVGNRTGELIREALVSAGAPADLVTWIPKRASRKKTAMFLAHPGVSLVLATGGAGMVKAAYRSGTPAIGVGPANTPTLICADSDPDQVAAAVVISKSFDNGLICGAEHNLIVERGVREPLLAAFERAGAAVLTPDEAARFQAAAIDPATGTWRTQIIGQGASTIAGFVGVSRSFPIRLLIVPAEADDLTQPLAGEKMFPVLSLFTVDSADEGIDLASRLLAQHGAGHTAGIHTHDEAVVARFGRALQAGRILVNSPSVQGVVGATSGLEPSFTLGCGTFGGNSTTDNIGFRHLLNVKRVAHVRQPVDAG